MVETEGEKLSKISYGDGKYYVSNLGNVYNSLTGRILKPNDIGNGYLQVTLYDNKTRKSFLIHRLVATAFKNNSKNLSQINHIDRCTSNNHESNLEWSSPSYNVQHSYNTGRSAPSITGRSFRVLDSIQSEVIRSIQGKISTKKIAEYFNVNRSTVRNHFSKPSHARPNRIR